ncbi:hypothetical protein E2C01_030429 [Portunus trituberculatus]|uniref:Uncharacterized protein n=1 Tax=Portunus trituberculatus TaxID=210409 RepID=A0A5B7EUR7_PORTR|nr:hypothetical protein [Portunus trituberculatus]
MASQLVAKETRRNPPSIYGNHRYAESLINLVASPQLLNTRPSWPRRHYCRGKALQGGSEGAGERGR